MPLTQTIPFWWEIDDEKKQLKEAVRLFQDYVTNDADRLTALRAWDAIYTNREITGNSNLLPYMTAFKSNGRQYSKVPLNAAKIMVDAVTARVTRQAIAVKFLTETHDFDSRKGARQMERYVTFQEHQGGGQAVAEEAFLHAVYRGTGVVATTLKYKEDDVEQEAVDCWDVFADKYQATHMCLPDNLFRRKRMSRSKLMAWFPEKKKEIRKAGDLSPLQKNVSRIAGSADNEQLVEVVYGWKLPSYKNAGDGRFIMFIEGAVLDSGEWQSCGFPLEFMRWKKDPNSKFWGMGLVEELATQHFDFNISLFSIYRSVEIMPRPILLTSTGARIKEGQIGNMEGVIVETADGSIPRLELPMSVPTDIANLLQMQWSKMLETSRLAALGLPESTGGGFETGAALRDFNDIQSTELAPNFKAWQDFRVAVAEQLITGGVMLNNRAKERGETYKIVMDKDRYTIEEIDWDNIALDPQSDSYVIRALPASALSQTFAGKKADVMDLLNTGLIDRETGLALLDFPDTQDFFDSITASRRAIEMQIDKILDEGVPVPFDPNNNLRLGLKMFQAAISKAVMMDVPQERISLLRSTTEGILKLIEREQIQTRNMAMGLGGGLPVAPPAQDINGAAPQDNAQGVSNAY
jgi:hypothetical protein